MSRSLFTAKKDFGKRDANSAAPCDGVKAHEVRWLGNVILESAPALVGPDQTFPDAQHLRGLPRMC